MWNPPIPKVGKTVWTRRMRQPRPRRPRLERQTWQKEELSAGTAGLAFTGRVGGGGAAYARPGPPLVWLPASSVYSVRRATSGSMREARKDGTAQARAAMRAKRPATPA